MYYRDDLPNKHYYELIINDIDTYEAEKHKIYELGQELGRIIAKDPSDRTAQERLSISGIRKEMTRLTLGLDEIQKRPMSLVQMLADHLHRTECKYNHSDQCGYYYEVSWRYGEHLDYLKKAEKLLDRIGEDKARELLKLDEEKKKIKKKMREIVSK